MAVPTNESFAGIGPANKCEQTDTIESIDSNGIPCCPIRCTHVIVDKPVKIGLFELRDEQHMFQHDQDDLEKNTIDAIVEAAASKKKSG